MDDLQREKNDLVLSDRHLAAGEQRIAGQIDLIEWMTERGYDTTAARELLRLLEETLVTWQEHRQLILDAIARHKEARSHLPRTSPGTASP
jgi:hypothetical protein